MTADEVARRAADKFLLEKIDTVPHLEALLLLWNKRPKSWAVEEMAKELYLAPEPTRAILDDLVRQELIVLAPAPGGYRYEPEAERDRLIGSVDSIYRRELIRVTRLIHSKPSSAVRAFAQAFRLTKDRD